MGAGKRLSCLILSLILCFTALNAVVAAETFTPDIYEMADALNKLNILQGGDKGEYYLDDNLERAQATALIIRMLGKEDHVRQNAALYRYTKFADVDPNQWYAPYVGYGTQGKNHRESFPENGPVFSGICVWYGFRLDECIPESI